MRLGTTALMLFAAFAVCVCSAQVNGVPASVTSFGFGGSQSASPGVPASVTSLGPRGFQCCIRSMSPNPPLNSGNRHRFNHGYGVPVFVPYYSNNYSAVDLAPSQDADSDSDDGDAAGPTVFEHRRSRQRSAEAAYGRGYEEGRAAAEDSRLSRRYSEPTSEPRAATVTEEKLRPAQVVDPAVKPAIEPKTVLVYRDGHKEEVTNYAIVGDDLFDFTSARRKIAITALDVPATVKANDERGLDFQLPVARAGN